MHHSTLISIKVVGVIDNILTDAFVRASLVAVSSTKHCFLILLPHKGVCNRLDIGNWIIGALWRRIRFEECVFSAMFACFHSLRFLAILT